MSDDAPLVIRLGEPGSDDASLVGGKAAALGRLAARGPVPPGFCLTPQALLEGISDGVMTPPLARTLGAAYGELGRLVGQDPPLVAVRSSAVDEDGADASFAGQYETFLHVRGVQAVTEAVLSCWRSAGDERVRAYRRRMGLGATAVLAVLVQNFVAADVSVVAFSLDPVEHDADVICVNATWGLGEGLVGGTVSPDTYVVRKRDLVPVSQRLGAKDRMTIVADTGGTREVPVPRLMRRQPALTPQELQAVGRLVRDLEGAKGRAVDVECAFSDGRLHLLQCRPVTVAARPPEGRVCVDADAR